MRKRVWGCILALLLLLCGCSGEPERSGAGEQAELQSAVEPQIAGETQSAVEQQAAGKTQTAAENPSGEKQEIVLMATDRMENMLAGFITAYNQQSEEYYITYEELFDDAVGYDGLVSRLNARLVSDNSPDLVIINYNFFQTYVEAEALENLNPYLQESQVIGYGDYLEELLVPFEKKGGLYGIPRSFMVQTLLVRGWEEPDGRGWSMEEFLDFLEEHPETAFSWERSSFEVLKYCLQYGMDRYVDYEAGKCYFDGEGFGTLLRRIRELSDEDVQMAQIRRESADNGGILITEYGISSFTDIIRAQIRYEGEMTHMGYPAADTGLQCRLLPGNAIGLCANSKNKEAAWEIAEQYLQYPFDSYEFPTKREEFEALLSEKTTRQYVTNEDGGEVEQPVEYYYGEPIYALSPEQAEVVLEAVKAATADDAVRENIRGFVLEEAAEYLFDRKTLEEVQQIIQRRVQLYLAERQ